VLTICKAQPEEDILDTARIVAELKSERDRLNQAIAALEGQSSHATAKRGAVPHQAAQTMKRDRLTPAGRKRLSDMMKKRWAERKKKDSSGR